MNYYTTQGQIGAVPGTVVVKSRGIREAQNKLIKLSTKDKKLAFDIDDLSRVTGSTMWTHMRELIKGIEAGGKMINVKKLGPGVFIEVH